MVIFCQRAWLPEGWVAQVRLSIDGDGSIGSIERGVEAKSGDTRVDSLMPAQANLHSHAFQRAMAGMTEYRAAGKESFWTWRTLMYAFLEHLTPEDMQAIASLVYMEMLEAGYASVGEFHYVHHQRDGTFYSDPAELSRRIFAAAETSGIGLTHLPVLYSYGGAQKQPLQGGQKRFGHTPEQFNRLVEILAGDLQCLAKDTRLGIAPHSLRATEPPELGDVVSAHDQGPIHIHMSEQPKEVQEISDWLGARPVEWLLDNHAVRDNWCLIHATHMTETETRALAKTGAVVGLCPITESNLGDGPFNGADYLKHSGRFGVGSDSNIRISMTEELRTLEYSQRLRDLQRNVLVPKEGSVGTMLYTAAAKGSAQAIARNAGSIEKGKLADLVAIDTSGPYLCGLNEDQLLDGLIFAADDRVVTDVWAAGRHQVQQGQHIKRNEIITAFQQTMTGLQKRLAQ